MRIWRVDEVLFGELARFYLASWRSLMACQQQEVLFCAYYNSPNLLQPRDVFAQNVKLKVDG